MADSDSLRSLYPQNRLYLFDSFPSQRCSHCSLATFPGQLLALQDDSLTHIHCLHPTYRVPISRQSVSLCLSEASYHIFEDWLHSYNESFRTVDIRGATSIAPLKTATVRDRSLLEAFKFCSVRECACILPLVNSAWRTHSLDLELWAGLVARTYPSVGAASADPRTDFISQCCLTCYGCGTQVAPGSLVTMKHPVTKQPLCNGCFPMQKFHQVGKKMYSEYLGLDEGYLDSCGVRGFEYNRKTYVLPCEVEDRVCEYRRKRGLVLCKELSKGKYMEAVEYLESIDIMKSYEREKVMEAVVAAPSDQIKRYVRYVFFEDSTDLQSLLIIAPNRNGKRKLCVCPAQLPSKIPKTLLDLFSSQ